MVVMLFSRSEKKIVTLRSSLKGRFKDRGDQDLKARQEENSRFSKFLMINLIIPIGVRYIFVI